MANEIQIKISGDSREARQAFSQVMGASRRALGDIQKGFQAVERDSKGFRGTVPEIGVELSNLATSAQNSFNFIAATMGETSESNSKEFGALITDFQDRLKGFFDELPPKQKATLKLLREDLIVFQGQTVGVWRGIQVAALETWQRQRDFATASATATVQAFAIAQETIRDVFFEAITGETVKLKDVFFDMGKLILREWTDVIAKMVSTFSLRFLKFVTEKMVNLVPLLFGGGAPAFALGGGGGLPFLDKILSPVTKIVKKIPVIGGFFQQGTPFVPHDMLAFLHQGEAIVPRELNPFAGDLREPKHSFGTPRNFGLEGRMDRLMGLLERQSRPFQVRFERGAFHGAQIRSDRDVDRLALEIEKRLRRRERLQLVPRVG